ncbi:MAG TPA: hypothetical protein VKJ07_25935, partial [Mycobacteriales bacterium]|nr:hypothetical protein [Mycobacteriales bacterium]
MVAERLEVIRQPQVDNTRLDDGVTVADVDFEDALHARQSDHDTAADRQTAARQARPRAARHERHSQLGACPDDRDDLLGRIRENDDI